MMRLSWFRPRAYVVQIDRAHTEQYSRNLLCVPPRPSFWRRLAWWRS